MRIPFFNRKSPSMPHLTGASIRSPRVEPSHAAHLRQMQEFNGRSIRAYEAAITNNLNADFPVSISSANAEILVSITAARSRARRLERDNPYAWSIIESMQKNVGGHEPFRLKMRVGKYDAKGTFIEEMDTNRKIEAAWKRFGRPQNFTVRRNMSRLEYYLQQISAFVRDGGVLTRHHRAFPNNPFKYAVEPIEIDRLDHYYQRPANGPDNEIQFSIELDKYKAPIAYWILTRHPGDIFAWSNEPKYRERVDAKDVVALFDIRNRAEQYVAVPRFASIIQRLHRDDQFDIAHCTAAIFAACKPFFLVREFPTNLEYVPDYVKTAISAANDGNSSQTGQQVSNVTPGTAEELPYGFKPMMLDPHFPVESATGFKKDNLKAAAAGSGTAYHNIANDLENVNFSSGRLGENAFHDTCKILQEHVIQTVCHPVFEEWLPYAIMSGQLDLPLSRVPEFCDAAGFIGRRWPYINPLQDAQADILRISGGLDSRDHVIMESERGGDVEQVNSEIASGRKSDEAHDLDFTNTDPTEPGNDPTAGEAPLPSKKGGKQTIKPRNRINGHQNGNLIEV